MAPPETINWAIYNSLPPKEAEYQLAHVHDSKRAATAITYIICLPTIFLAVLMRFVSRRIGHIKYGADDWIMVLGLTLVIMDSTPAILAVFAYGGARHAILMTDQNVPRFAKSAFASEAAYAPTIGVVKISTLLLFARIFEDRKFRRILWAIGLFISIYSAVMVITVVFQCRPIKRIWNSDIKAECVDISKLWMVMGSLNVITDFLILCLPLPRLWKLQMSRGTKLQLIGIFSIGSFATMISIYRIAQLRGLSLDSYDPSWSDVEPSLWSVIEASAITVGACAITYRPLFNWIFRIQPLSASLGVRTRLASQSNVGGDIKMQVRRGFQAPLSSSSIPSSRIVGTEDGFRRIRDSTEV